MPPTKEKKYYNIIVKLQSRAVTNYCGITVRVKVLFRFEKPRMIVARD